MTIAKWTGAVVGFLGAATFCALFFQEYLGWDRGVIKIAAPLALGGAFLGYELVERVAAVFTNRSE